MVVAEVTAMTGGNIQQIFTIDLTALCDA